MPVLASDSKTKLAVTSSHAPPPSAYLSSAISAPGVGLTFVSGACGVKDGKFVEGTVKDRTKQALANVQALLAEQSLTLDDVVSTVCYLSKYTEDFASFNEAYLEAFSGSVKPSRTCIGVAALPANTDVEITVTALQRGSAAKRSVSSANAPPPAPFLSSAIATDKLVFVSGSCGVKDGKFIKGTVQDRARLAFENVRALLKEENLDLQDVVSTVVYLSKYTEDYPKINEVYMDLFPGDKPTRTCIGVKNLPAGTDVEITCVAARRAINSNKALTSKALSPQLPFLSPAVISQSSNLLFISGMTGPDAQPGSEKGHIGERTTAAIRGIERALQEVGLDLSDVVSSTIYLSNYTQDFPGPYFNQAYTAAFPDPKPSRTCIGVTDLPNETDVEITCIAAVRNV